MADTGADKISLLNPLDTPNWDVGIAELPGATFFHGLAWAQVLHGTYGFQPAYFALGSPGRPTSLLPTMEVASWITGRRCVSLPFTDSLEPLCPNERSFRTLVEGASQYGQERQWKYLDLRGGSKWLVDSARSIEFFTHQLTLRPCIDDLSSGLNETTRRAIRWAERGGLKTDFSQSLEATRIFYRLHCLTRKRHGVPPQPYSFFANIHRHILSCNKGWIVLAQNGKEPVAGAMFFHFGGSAIFKFGASSDAGRKTRGNYLVMWRAIEWYASQGYLAMEYGRTSLQSTGLRQFKLGWGTSEQKAGYFRLVPGTSRFLRMRDPSSAWYTSVVRFLPLSLSQIAGNLIYRHFG